MRAGFASGNFVYGLFVAKDLAIKIQFSTAKKEAALHAPPRVYCEQKRRNSRRVERQ
jgi:hypothetical protein